MSRVLALGGYSTVDREALRDEFDAVFVDDGAALAALPGDVKTRITAMAFSGAAPLGGPMMDLLPNLGVISNYGVGYDAIDVVAATERDIRVTNTPDVLNDDVADLAVAMLLAQGRQMIAGSEWVRSGNWAGQGGLPLARKISGGVAGIVGLGRIGRAIADRLAAFGMEIHYSSRSEKPTPGWTYHGDPVSLARSVEYLIVALVGGAETRGHISREVLAALGPRGILVNISRGSTVDEAALLDALETGTIAGAALDVFLNEPAIDARFLALDNVLLQPHVGSATVETRAEMAQLQRDNIRAALDGAPLLTAVN